MHPNEAIKKLEKIRIFYENDMAELSELLYRQRLKFLKMITREIALIEQDAEQAQETPAEEQTTRGLVA